jgi:hypothetical protein
VSFGDKFGFVGNLSDIANRAVSACVLQFLFNQFCGEKQCHLVINLDSLGTCLILQIGLFRPACCNSYSINSVEKSSVVW